MDREECISSGLVWIDGYKRKDGTYVHGYCKNVPTVAAPVAMEFPPPSMEFPPPSFEVSDIPEEKNENVQTHHTSDDPLASKNVKLPKSNTINARRIYGDIKKDEKRLGGDLRTQDFEDAAIQSEHIEKESEREIRESDKLSASQAIKAQELYAAQKRRIAKREYRETRKRIKSEAKATKHQIRSENKRIKHEKKQRRREKKLERLRGK